jgi:hypothetical protein
MMYGSVHGGMYAPFSLSSGPGLKKESFFRGMILEGILEAISR